MIFNNNIKTFVEASKNNIDRMIISSRFDFHLTLNQIARNIEVAYDTEISTDYISQIINKHTIIMSDLNKKANHIAAPMIQHISSDELYCLKYSAKKGVLYSTHDVHSSS